MKMVWSSLDNEALFFQKQWLDLSYRGFNLQPYICRTHLTKILWILDSPITSEARISKLFVDSQLHFSQTPPQIFLLKN